MAEPPSAEATLVTSVRQQHAIEAARASLAQARSAAQSSTPHELLLLDLYAALGALDELTGDTTSDDVLNLIFSYLLHWKVESRTWLDGELAAKQRMRQAGAVGLPRRTSMASRILRLPTVLLRTGLSRSTIYARITEGRFPRQVSLGPNSVGWRETDIDGWIDSLTSRRYAAG